MKSSHHEDSVVPALSMKKPIDFNTVGEDDFNGGGDAPLSSKDGEVSASQEEINLSNVPPS